MASNLTIKDIVELKGCSADVFIRLASEKGISLPEGENSEISLAELRVIDPSLAYKLRYKKPVPKTTIEESFDSQEDMATKENEQATQQTLHSLESLGTFSKEASGAPEEDSFFQEKNLILEELISMVDYADKLTIEDVRAIRQKWEDCGIGRGIEFKD
ncbi:MAG: hypothetical protein IJT83_07585, partial [Victivallales bacterium]|nr:hypothetical protein [Victivallales bacterium]